MNPDPNQPQDQPQEPVQTPAPEVQAVPAAPSDTAAEPTLVSSTPTTPQESITPVNTNTEAPALASPSPFTTVPDPVAPAQVGSTNNAAPGASKGPNKKLIILLSVLVGALVLLGVAALIVVSLILPTKKDYRDAVRQLNVVQSAYSDLNSSASSLSYDTTSSTTDTKFNNDLDAYKKDLTTFQTENDKFMDMKAVKSGTVKSFDAYKMKITDYLTYVQNSADSLEKYRPAGKACDSETNTAALLSQCVDALNKVGTLSNTDLNTFVVSSKDLFKQYLDIVNQIGAIKDPYGAQYDQYKALRDKGYDLLDKITSSATDLRSNDSKHVDEIDPSKAANALSDELETKE